MLHESRCVQCVMYFQLQLHAYRLSAAINYQDRASRNQEIAPPQRKMAGRTPARPSVNALRTLTPLGLGHSQPATQAARACAGPLKSSSRSAQKTGGKSTSPREVDPQAEHPPRPRPRPAQAGDVGLGTREVPDPSKHRR